MNAEAARYRGEDKNKEVRGRGKRIVSELRKGLPAADLTRGQVHSPKRWSGTLSSSIELKSFIKIVLNNLS